MHARLTPFLTRTPALAGEHSESMQYFILESPSERVVGLWILLLVHGSLVHNSRRRDPTRLRFCSLKF